MSSLKKVLRALGLLTALLFAAPTASAATPAERVSKRVREIETRLLGSAHAAEHARQRRAAAAGSRQATGAPLKADNGIVDADEGGFWSPGVKLPIVAINATLMRTGRILVFAYPWRPGRPDPETGEKLVDPGYANAYVFDPVTGRSREVPPPIDPDTGKPAYIFCAGTSTLPDGRVLIVGGNVGDPTAAQNKGLNTVFTFDPATESWETHERTRQGRWYPSLLEIPDGRTMIFGGIPKPGDPDWAYPTEYRLNTDVELFDPVTNDVDRVDNFRADEQPGHPPLPGQYPRLWWMPSGHALVTGPRKSDTWRFAPPAPGVEDAVWEDVPDLPIHREWAPGVLMPGSSTVMLFGGANRDDHVDKGFYPANGSTTVFDDSYPAAGWRDGPDMRVERAFHNAVQLPDGRVAIVGGGFGEDPSKDRYRWEFRDAQKRVEVYDPETQTFALGNAQAEGRTYHSTALLLPDARVMSAGDDVNGPTGPDSGVRTDTAEIWSPPYLYEDGCEPRMRPVISQAPAAVGYGAAFSIRASGSVTRAVLVAPGADTHNTDMSQRVVPLAAPVASGPGRLSLRAPADPNLAPPGYYMLFVLDGRGTPSVARFVHVGGSEPGLAATVRATPVSGDCKPIALRLRRAGRNHARVTVSRPAMVTLRSPGAKPRSIAFRKPATRRVRVAGARVRAVARPRSGPVARATLRR